MDKDERPDLASDATEKGYGLSSAALCLCATWEEVARWIALTNQKGAEHFLRHGGVILRGSPPRPNTMPEPLSMDEKRELWELELTLQANLTARLASGEFSATATDPARPVDAERVVIPALPWRLGSVEADFEHDKITIHGTELVDVLVFGQRPEALRLPLPAPRPLREDEVVAETEPATAEAGPDQPDAPAALEGRNCPPSDTQRAADQPRRFSQQEANDWYVARVQEWVKGSRPPGRDADIAAAKARFPGISREAVRGLRRAHAPEEWQVPGKPSGKSGG